MEKGRRIDEGKHIHIGRVILVIIIITLIIFGIYLVVNRKKIFSVKDNENHQKVEEAIFNKEKTIEEILAEFGGEVIEQPKEDTYFVSKEGNMYTIYADGDIVEGQIIPWNGESKEIAADEAGNYNVYSAEELKWVADKIINGEKNFNGVTITLRNNIDLGARPKKDGTWEGPIWTSMIGFLDEIKKEQPSQEQIDGQSDNTQNNLENVEEKATVVDEVSENVVAEEKLKRFAGIFNGNGFTIRGVYIDSDKNYQGLFGHSSGIIQNLAIKNSYISGGNGTGALIGLNAGIIQNCYTENTIVKGKSDKVGGIVGITMSGSKIENCYTKLGSIEGNNASGGIVGYANNNASILASYNMANITGKAYTGGIVGIMFYGSIIQSTYNTGTIVGSDYTGGIAGYTATQIEKCYNTGSVTGENYVGGIVGVNFTMGNIIISYNTGNVIGNNNIGGIAGTNNASISSCYNVGKIETEGYRAGGICGQNGTDSYIYTSYNVGDIEGKRNLGGIAGGDFGTSSNCYYLKDASIAIENEEQCRNSEQIKADILSDLGAEFTKDDSANINQGYPVLTWQISTEAVTNENASPETSE